MTRKQLWVIVALGLFGGVGLLVLSRLDSLTPSHTTSEKTATEPTGPHGGMLLGHDQPVALEVLSRADRQGRLQLRLYAIRQGHTQPLTPQALQASWLRLGQRQVLHLQPEQDGLAVQETMDEPQSFQLEARLRDQGQSYRYSWDHFENRLTLTPAQLQENGAALGVAGPRVLSENLELPGKIAVDPLRFAQVTPPLNGQVKAVYKRPGDAVHQGEALALIDSRELGNLKLDYLTARTLSEQARQRYSLEQGFFQATQTLLGALNRDEAIESLHQRLLRQPIGLDRQRLIEAYSLYQLAQQTWTREKSLLPQHATTEADYQQAQQAWIAARAAYQATLEDVARQRRLALLEREQELVRQQPALLATGQKLQALGQAGGDTSPRYVLRAPLSGRIQSSNITLGQTVDPASVAWVVVDLSQVWAQVQVAESQLEQVRLGLPVTVRSQTGSRSAPGRITQQGTAVDEATRTAQAQVTLANPDAFWRPGMFVTITLPAAQRSVPLAVPQAAIQRIEEQPVVFVQDGEALQAMPVVLGQQAGGWVEIREGLRPGQRYVMRNSFVLKAELGKSSAEED